MKNNILISSISLFVILFIISCNEAETIVESGPSETQVLIIEKYDASKIAESMSTQLEENKYHSSMITYDYYDMEMPNRANPDSWLYNRKFGASLSVTGESTLTEVDSAYRYSNANLPDSMLHPIRLGKVKIGDIVMEEDENANVRGRRGTYGGREVWLGWEYLIKSWTHNLEEIFNSSALSGPKPFTITNSPTIKDVNTTIYLPVHNEIINIEQHQVIDTLNDLTIELKEPIGGSEKYIGGYLVFYAHYYDIRIYENGSQIRGGWIDGITILPIESTRKLVIPSEELIKFKDEYKDAQLFSIYLSAAHPGTTKIPLYNSSDGSLFDVIRPFVHSSFQIVIKFKE